MPLPFILVLAAALGVAAAVAIAVWPKILAWAEQSLFPWVQKNMPSLEQTVRRAFVVLDEVATTVRRAAKKAWEELKHVLLKQVIEIERRTNNENIRRVTSWIVKTLQSGKEVPTKVVTEEAVEFEDLPDDIRAEFLRRGNKVKTVDVKEVRDQELLQMATAN